MQARVILVIPVALLVWWFSHRLVRPDDGNWIMWIIGPDGWVSFKVLWAVFCFSGSVAIIASLVLFLRRSTIAFLGVLSFSYGFAWCIAMGFKSSGDPMAVHTVVTLTLGMLSSVPIVFADLIAGKQIDIVGTAGA